MFTIYASPWTPRYETSAFQYPSEEDRSGPSGSTPVWAKNVATDTSLIPEGIDIVMTYGPSKYLLDGTVDGNSAGCEHLRRAIARTRPRLHCFGHMHAGYGAQRVAFDESTIDTKTDPDSIAALPKKWVGKNQANRKGYANLPPGSADAFRNNAQTLLVNAAIMDEINEPLKVPWMVELTLSIARSTDHTIE